jgi:hypothetical protein
MQLHFTPLDAQNLHRATLSVRQTVFAHALAQTLAHTHMHYYQRLIKLQRLQLLCRQGAADEITRGADARVSRDAAATDAASNYLLPAREFSN